MGEEKEGQGKEDLNGPYPSGSIVFLRICNLSFGLGLHVIVLQATI